LSGYLVLNLGDCEASEEKRFKQICPALIAAAVRANTQIYVYDRSNDALSDIAADEI
jgi:hypothetical protein